MKKKVLTLLLLLAAAVALLVAAGCGKEEAAAGMDTVILGGEKFRFELALSPEEYMRGLAGRTAIDDNGGMLFVFPAEGPVVFWMKDCLIPLDLIYLDDSGTIVGIFEMEAPAPGTPDAELPHYPSPSPARFAIELRGGRAAELGLAVGQKVELRLDELKEAVR